jgi:hypothetical protein
MSGEKKVVPFRVVPKEPVVVEEQETHPDEVLDLMRGTMQDVIVLGWDKETGSFCMAHSPMDAGQVLVLLEAAKKVSLSRHIGDE